MAGYYVWITPHHAADYLIGSRNEASDALDDLRAHLAEHRNDAEGPERVKGGYIMFNDNSLYFLHAVAKVYRGCVTIWAVRDEEQVIIW